MAQFSVEINDTDVSRVLDAIAGNYNRPETVLIQHFQKVSQTQGLSIIQKLKLHFLIE